MSTYVDEKLTPQRPSLGGAAQASRKHLLARRGAAEVSADHIVIDTMGGREVWRRIAAGVDGMFEQEVRS